MKLLLAFGLVALVRFVFCGCHLFIPLVVRPGRHLGSQPRLPDGKVTTSALQAAA